MEWERDWSGMLPELLREIACRTQSVDDFLAFRGVCVAWRSAATNVEFRKTRMIPLGLMLPDKEDNDDWELYSLSKEKIGMRIKLPDLKGKGFIGFKFGWLLTLSKSGEVTLLNPISCAQIHLPNYKTFPNYQGETNPEFLSIRGAALSNNPSNDPVNFMLFVSLDGMLGYWGQGDESWTRIPSERFGPQLMNMEYYNNKLYVVFTEHIVVWDPCERDELKVVLEVDFGHMVQDAAFKLSTLVGSLSYALYIVESSHGNLLLITRVYCKFSGDENYDTVGFIVMRIDVDKCECKVMESLENDAIFVGGVAISIPDAGLPDMIKPNCIYFTEDIIDEYKKNIGEKLLAQDMGICNIGEHKNVAIELFTIDTARIVCRRSIWIDSSIIMNSL